MTIQIYKTNCCNGGFFIIVFIFVIKESKVGVIQRKSVVLLVLKFKFEKVAAIAE